MAASRADVDRWIETAKAGKCEFIISVCDTFDYEDYPVYCENREELIRRYPEYDGNNMQRVNEIIQIVQGNIVVENLNINTIIDMSKWNSAVFERSESSQERKTSAEWLKQYPDYQILDPDGWDRSNFDYSFKVEKIMKEEFEKRLFESTCLYKRKK